MKYMLIIICGILAGLSVQAQTTTNLPASTSQKTGAPAMSYPSSASDRSGIIVDYRPGAAIALNSGTGQPTSYILGQNVEITGADGKAIEEDQVKANARANIHLTKEGMRSVVDKIVVDNSQ